MRLLNPHALVPWLNLSLLNIHTEDTGAVSLSQTVCKLAVMPIYLGRLLVCDNIIREVLVEGRQVPDTDK